MTDKISEEDKTHFRDVVIPQLCDLDNLGHANSANKPMVDGEIIDKEMLKRCCCVLNLPAGQKKKEELFAMITQSWSNRANLQIIQNGTAFKVDKHTVPRLLR